MAKKKEKAGNPTAADLPQNPEFQAFADFTRRLMSVPKSEVPPQGHKRDEDDGHEREEDREHADE